VVAWPLLPIFLETAAANATLSSWQWRLLQTQQWLHLIPCIAATVRARRSGRTRAFVAMIGIIAWVINVLVTAYASIGFGRPPL
jgi:hypothetical protein